MLIVAGLTAASAAYATITIARIEQGKNINRALSSFYAAEGSAEQALYFIKRDQVSSTVDKTLNSYDIPSGTPKTFTENGVKFFRDAHTLLPDIVISRVPANGVIPIELYDPLDLSRGACYQADGSYKGGAPYSGCVSRLALEWKSTDVVDVEIRWVAWLNNEYGNAGVGGTVIDGGYSGEIDLLNPSFYTSAPDLSRYNNFRVRVRPLFGDMYSVRITAKNRDSSVGHFPGFFVVDATGVDGTNRQKVRLAVPQQEIAAPWWDFVFFVENYTR
ncbi:MAG: hypothetical protein A3H59_02180 [Candidatus Jacksonbacteria bacterium RIFCSPLOWO2_02_FULL_43_9]|nr:MAG: hypothetical protein A3B94_02040 [Candidatus Jacksonbacteria bacterium RIFCSPHIGHO2_02_FULL_43_10]OGY71616.1 MAG: hypothetical protein A2986_01770 [Candidatus Jacksonbacteria bacterium RIFCSPLOWO2_01_FULL_44_13]OGY74413.1 MAG: hypothetical protein A3H59_02180 [Candidatus Jacksonbacteria bacterium RIFCSPLOWO2_02_FULL_43_9]HAZ16615.1 hypothetical protein [Candidatus Jacksonbacteria bacterium]